VSGASRSLLAPDLPTILLGVAVAVGLDTGILTLFHADGTRSRLTAPPALLRTVRLGGPVQVVVEGTSVRALRCL